MQNAENTGGFLCRENETLCRVFKNKKSFQKGCIFIPFVLNSRRKKQKIFPV